VAWIATAAATAVGSGDWLGCGRVKSLNLLLINLDALPNLQMSEVNAGVECRQLLLCHADLLVNLKPSVAILNSIESMLV
jgi:hypothetical protein